MRQATQLMIIAFRKWVKRHGSKPWEDELEQAFNAGYRAAIKDVRLYS